MKNKDEGIIQNIRVDYLEQKKNNHISADPVLVLNFFIC